MGWLGFESLGLCILAWREFLVMVGMENFLAWSGKMVVLGMMLVSVLMLERLKLIGRACD